MKRPALLAAVLLLGACAHSEEWIYDYNSYLHNRGLRLPTTESFDHCHGYGCKIITPITLSPASWKKIDKIFKKPSKTAQQERDRVAKAIGVFEQEVGAIDGTSEDVGDTFKKLGTLQLDCADESTDTTVYLALLEQRGHLKFHRVRKPQMRFAVFAGSFWPHLTAVMTDTETGTDYAVDSWFDDNGQPAYVVPLDEWRAGWKPKRNRGG